MENSLNHERKPGREPSAIVFVPTVVVTPPPHIAHSTTPRVDTRLLSPPRFPELCLTPSRRQPPFGRWWFPMRAEDGKGPFVRGRGVARAISIPSVYPVRNRTGSAVVAVVSSVRRS